MSHPSREELTAYLYEELDGAEKSALVAHLRECPACRESAKLSQQTMRALNQWKLEPKVPRPALFPWARWAAAAAIFLTCGILIGRSARPQADLSARLAQAEAAAAETRAALAQLTKDVAERRDRDEAAYLSALEKSEARHANELRAMRKDLETVAALTEVGFRSAQSEIVRLAGYSGEAAR